MLFQRLPTKFFKSELFSRLPKVDHVTTVVKDQETEREGRGGKRTDYYPTEFSIVLRVMKFFSSFSSGIKTHKAKPSIGVVVLETHFAEEEAVAKSSSV